MNFKNWKRNELLMLYALIIGILTLIATITVPEIRDFIGLTSNIPPNKNILSKTKINLQKSINIKIFNACKSKNAHIKLKDYLMKYFPENININTEYNWKYRYEMDKTEIFYISDKNIAYSMEDFLNGVQIIVDYENEGKARNFFGLEKRDLVIFIGNDYEVIFNKFHK